MATLAIDTVSSACAVFIKTAEGTSYECCADIGRGHAEHLIGQIDEALAALNIGYSNLKLIGINRGPGSFTGVRVGIAAARGLAVALGIPARGVSTLNALYHDHGENQPTLVILDAKRGEYYAELFKGQEKVLPGPMLYKGNAPLPTLWLEERSLRLVGSGAKALLPHLPNAQLASENALPKTSTIAHLAEEMDDTAEKPTPLYLRAPDAKPQTKGLVERLYP